MIDIKLIRDNPDLVKENIKKKFQEDKLVLVDNVRKKDEEWRKLKYSADSLRKERNIISEEIRSVLMEMSIREIRTRILDTIKLPEMQKYKVDEYNYENIPLSIFMTNGITPIHLKQYSNSHDIMTFDVGVNINPVQKNVDIFLQKSGIFN